MNFKTHNIEQIRTIQGFLGVNQTGVFDHETAVAAGKFREVEEDWEWAYCSSPLHWTFVHNEMV